jgi:hypothetical protein
MALIFHLHTFPNEASIPRRPRFDEEVAHARRVELPLGPQCRKRVRVRGERLHRIHWQGRQWAVTGYGLEKRDGTYAIAKDRLWNSDFEDNHAGWVRHMGLKIWIDLADFAEALRVARQIHCPVPHA